MMYRSKSEIVYEHIREGIESGRYRPGDRFSAQEIALELGVSRTPVNEAMKRLSEYGLIRILPNVGYEVISLGIRDIREIMEIECLLERQAISWMQLPLDPEKLEDLRRLARGILAAGDRQDRREYNRLTNLLHQQFIELAGSRVLSEIYGKSRHFSGWDDARIIEMTGELDQVNREHLELLDALEQQDRSKALAII